MTITNLDIAKMSTEELRSLNNSIVTELKKRRTIENVLATENLVSGQIVNVDHPKLQGRNWVILKVNKTKCKIHEVGNVNKVYSVPSSMIKTR